jgi:PilZ domain
VLEISLQYEGESAVIHVRPPDISTSGIFVSTSRGFPEGAIVTVQCKLAHSGAEISARGEVRYCLRGVGVGVEFTDISAEAIRAIESEIRMAGKAASRALAAPSTKKGKRQGRRTPERRPRPV